MGGTVTAERSAVTPKFSAGTPRFDDGRSQHQLDHCDDDDFQQHTVRYSYKTHWSLFLRKKTASCFIPLPYYDGTCNIDHNGTERMQHNS